jgi:arylsulfatase A-like enzyme/lysophospholipase L1-like esterase
VYNIIPLFILSFMCTFHAFAAEQVPRLYVIGDSTAASYPKERFPLTGWAQVLQEYVDETNIEVVNRASSGRSSKSYLDEGLWTPIQEALKSGDFVFIQFGHNDQKQSDLKRYTEPYGSYTEHLQRYVDDTRAAGATPVLLTSINRNTWASDTELGESLGDYPDAVRALAKTQGVALLDMEQVTRTLYTQVGKEDIQSIFLYFGPDQYPGFPEGKSDGTHLSELGARKVAQAAVDEMCTLGAPFTAIVKVSDAQHAKPNMLLILVDDLGYGDLSSYGSTDMRTPHIDGLMKQGMRFDNFYANSPVCSPTRASVLSGRYPDFAGVPGVIRTHPENSWGLLRKDIPLLPAQLQTAGYTTGIVGKWHLGLDPADHPIHHGFDFFHGFLGDMMDDYYTHLRHNINYMRLGTEEIHPEGHATDLFSDWSVEYIQDQVKTDNPFFLYLAYNAPHTPIQAPEEWLERVKKREPSIGDDRAKLVALIEHMDEGIGRVLASLKATGQDKNTLIIFTSDNGGQLNVGANNGDLQGGKQDMYEGGIRVPLCAVWAEYIEADTRSDHLGLTMDLMPTIAEACEVPVVEGLDGRSFLPALKGHQQSDPKRTLVWVRREGGATYGGQDYYAIRQGDWKLLQNSPFEALQLYNLAEDPGETNPLPQTHKMYRFLFQLLQGHVNKAGRIPWQR